jgi:hypothetical protein
MMSQVEIIIPISRPEHLQQLFSRLEHMDCNTDQTSLLAYVDGSDELFEQVKAHVEGSKFAVRRCLRRPRDAKTVAATDIMGRRKRIAAIHNELKAFVGQCDYVFGLEDDTIPPRDVIRRLLHDYAVHPHAGFIEGVELGRWGVAYVGAWKADSVYEPTSIGSVAPPSASNPATRHSKWDTPVPTIQEIDAGGFYCFMTKREHYVNHDFKTYGHNLLGPDVEFGLSLRQEGYKNFIDWSLPCKHFKPDGTALTLTNTTVAQVRIYKRKVGKNDVWQQRINYRGEGSSTPTYV